MISDKFKKFLTNSSESKMSVREAKRICENAGLKVSKTVSKPVDEEKSYALKEAKRICENAGLKVSKKVPENVYEAKGVNTNTRAFQTKVQQHIKDYWEDHAEDGESWIESLKMQIKALQHRPSISTYEAACEMVQGGCFDVYYSQVQETMAEWFECSEDEIDEYYKGDDSRMFDVYKHFCARAIEAIITGKKCYVK